MQGYPISQSSFRRAMADTMHAPRQNPWFFWIIGTVMVALGTFLGVIYTPEGSSKFLSIIYPIAGVILGAIIGIIIIFIINLILAPYRQRNEARDLLLAKPKPIPLLNRGELIRAISEVQQTSGELLMAQEQLDNLEAMSPNLVHVDAMETRDYTYAKYKQAINKLSAEKMVAGKLFESLLSDLIAYISTQVWVKEAKPTFIGSNPQQFHIHTALETFGRIASKVSEVTRKIDELSGQVHDIEGSQTE